MKVLVALPLILTFACAGMSSSTAGNSSASNNRSCTDGIPATAYKGADVYAAPDSSTPPVRTLNENTPVCASSETVGFGFRRIQLADGSIGYVTEASVNI